MKNLSARAMSTSYTPWVALSTLSKQESPFWRNRATNGHIFFHRRRSIENEVCADFPGCGLSTAMSIETPRTPQK